MASEMTYKQAALQVLQERGPMHYQDLADAIMKAGLIKTEASTPAASLNATIAVDIKRRGSVFIRTKPGVFGLRGVHEAAIPALKVQPSGTDEGEDTETEGQTEDGSEPATHLRSLAAGSEVRAPL